MRSPLMRSLLPRAPHALAAAACASCARCRRVRAMRSVPSRAPHTLAAVKTFETRVMPCEFPTINAAQSLSRQCQSRIEWSCGAVAVDSLASHQQAGEIAAYQRPRGKGREESGSDRKQRALQYLGKPAYSISMVLEPSRVKQNF